MNAFNPSDFLSCIRVVLVNTTLPANIGSTARAMHTMGLNQLIVVNPKRAIDDDAIAHSAGAKHVLENVQIVNSLTEAIDDCQWVLASSSRKRHLPQPVLTPRQSANLMVKNFIQSQQHAINFQIALVFGREDRGLTNDELQLADYHIQIPANPDYGILNVASAVQVIASVFYEIATEQAQLVSTDEHLLELTLRQQWDEPAINQQQKQQLQQRFLTLFTQLDLYHPEHAKNLPYRLTRLLNRLQLDVKEYQLLQAMIAKMQMKLSK